eukprot:scaffold299698_cov32-Tisochrysis_lutea.AAC.2
MPADSSRIDATRPRAHMHTVSTRPIPAAHASPAVAIDRESRQDKPTDMPPPEIILELLPANSME